MTADYSDTVANWQPTRLADAPIEDVFLDSVRVQLSWKDIEAAVERGAIVPSEAYALWDGWASPDNPRRVVAKPVPPPAAALAPVAPAPVKFSTPEPGLTFTNTFYFLGGMAVTGAMVLLFVMLG